MAGRKNNRKSLRDDIIKFAAESYGTSPEYLWRRYPGYAVLRRADNKKWYGIVMDVPRKRLGLSGEGSIDILDIKCGPVLGTSLRMDEGFLPAYHMRRDGWVTVLLDGTVEKETVFSLLEISFELAGTNKRECRRGKERWIIPANPKYYDLPNAFSNEQEIIWKQSNNIAVGDTVYMYAASPFSAVLYKCEATEVDIPFNHVDENLRINRVMRIKLLERFDPSFLTLDRLREHGMETVRGPRRMPESLVYELEGHEESTCLERENDSI